LDEAQKQNNNSPLVDIKIIEFLLLLAADSKNIDFIASLIKSKQKRRIKQFMEDNYLGSLKVTDYAYLTGRSISTFNREFKRLYDSTPNKWLIHKRLSKSKELLISTNKTVTEVSIEVGYENISHFINAYKNQYGITPKQQRIKIND
jgi:AraC-like DNA-binding protein